MSQRSSLRSLVTFSALAFLAVALLFILHPSDAPYRSYLRQGDAYAATTERTAAVAAYEQAARLRVGTPDPHFRMAELYLGWGRAAAAVDALTEAERLLAAEGGDDVLLERLWIEAYVARADWPAVVEHAHRLLVIAPDDREARHALARAYTELRAWSAAQVEYEVLLQTDAADFLAHERLGALMVGYDPSAVQHLFAAQTDLAGSLLEVLESPGAAEDPAYASALLGRVLFEEGEWALAVHQFERALSYSPVYPDAHAHLGHALDQMGYPDEAYPHLRQAVALNPDSPVARVFLGLHYERLGDYSAARAEYETAYDLDPESPAICVAVGRTWIVEGRYEVAEIWLVHAVSLRPDDPILWEILARFYLDHNMTSEERGVTATTRLVELSPDDARAHDLRGWAAMQVGDYDTARESLARAISLDPTLAIAYYHSGLLWKIQGDYEKAREAFARALDLDTAGRLAPLVERAMGTMLEPLTID